MIITIHNLAQTYKMLPSEALRTATTFDLYVLDVNTKYRNYQQDIADGKSVDKRNHPSEAEMLAMIKKVRGEK